MAATLLDVALPPAPTPPAAPAVPAALLPRLPRRHMVCLADAGAAAAAGTLAPASAAAAAAAAGLPGARRPRRVCIMVEPSPFTYVCGYMNRYRNTIRFLTEAGVEVMVVTPGPGLTLPGADFSAARDQVGCWVGPGLGCPAGTGVQGEAGGVRARHGMRAWPGRPAFKLAAPNVATAAAAAWPS